MAKLIFRTIYFEMIGSVWVYICEVRKQNKTKQQKKTETDIPTFVLHTHRMKDVKTERKSIGPTNQPTNSFFSLIELEKRRKKSHQRFHYHHNIDIYTSLAISS